MHIDEASNAELRQMLEQLEKQQQVYIDQHLHLDITRGKPSTAQLQLSDALDGILDGDYRDDNGTDLRNYGGLDGIPAAKQLFADMLGSKPENMFIGGNSSLSLMHYTLWFAYHLGLRDSDVAWKEQSTVVKFLCPCPGYDRHFKLCQELGIEMEVVPLTGQGPDMDIVEEKVKNDPGIKGIWCVPRFSNPTGEVYSEETVKRLANLGNIAGDNFLVMWDNAYVVHALGKNSPELANISDIAQSLGTENSIIQFGSTSKITFAGAGIGFMAASESILNGFVKHFGMASIGADKLNQMRHVKFLKDANTIDAHMQKHADIISPKFQAVDAILEQDLAGSGMGEWNKPQGGYFVSFNTRPGLAKAVVALAAEAGVKLTPAGATYPLGKDPQDSNIRIAPTFPELDELEQAMRVLTHCVKLASIRQKLA